MQFLLALYSDESVWPTMTEVQQKEGYAAYMAYSEALRKAGALIGSNRLKPAATANTIRVTNGKTQVLNGPYIDTREQLAGYYLIEAADQDAALAWAARCPGASHGTVEVRPIWPAPAA
jgi:hypothetical protein